MPVLLCGGAKLSIRIGSFDTCGFNQISVKTSTSYACASHLIISIFGIRLCIFRCMILKWLESMSNELKELDILDILASVSTESGPGLG